MLSEGVLTQKLFIVKRLKDLMNKIRETELNYFLKELKSLLNSPAFAQQLGIAVCKA